MNIKHKITPYLQPTNHSCSVTALAVLLSHYGENVSPEDLLALMPTNKDEQGDEIGYINQDLATFCVKRGYDVSIYSSDFQILDLSWTGLDNSGLSKKLESIKFKRDSVPILGEVWARRYINSYIGFINAGGKLKVQSFIGSTLIDELLSSGPILPAVMPGVLYSNGRSINIGLRQAEQDDIDGQLSTHSIVVYGKAGDDYLVADPWYGMKRVKIEPLILAIQAAQIECDNLLIKIDKSKLNR